MKFTYSANYSTESGKVFSIYFDTVEEALLMLKTFKKHFGGLCLVNCSWTIDGENFIA